MSQTLVQVRIDRELKEQTASIYAAIGMDLPTAIRMFFKKSVMVGGLPFDGRVPMHDNAAIAAVESMRAKVEATNAEEPSMDEINAFISSVRRSREDALHMAGQRA